MLKISLLLAITLLGFSSTAFSQKEALLLEAGIAVPIGRYQSKDKLDNNSGFARPRSMFAIAFNHRFENSRFGYILNISSIKNGYHGGEIFNMYKDSLPSIIVDTKPWSATMYLSGAFYSLPLDELSAIDFKGMVGLSDATSYGYMVRGYDFSKIQRHEKGDLGLGYAFALAFRTSPFDIEGFNILGSCSYISSNHNFKDVVTSDSRGSDGITSFKQKFQNLTISLGLYLEFN